MKNEPQSKKRGKGRPSKFTPAMLKQTKFLAERGCTDAELAGFFGISESTVNNWKKDHPKFMDALKEGKAVADNKIQRALFQRAAGFTHPDVHISNFQGVITVTNLTKHYPPDTTACIFWLKNRRPAEWRDKVDVAHSGSVDIEISIGGDDAE